MKLINIGFGNYINRDRIITLTGTESAPIKRMIREAGEQGRLVDASQGRKSKSVIVCDSAHLILSCLQPEILTYRINGDGSKEDSDDE